MVDPEFRIERGKLKGIDALVIGKILENKVNEAPYQTTYIKFPGHQYKKAMDILNTNIDPTYVKMDIVDNDGDGNVIVYFNFKHEAGFDDMYDDIGTPSGEFYQEPEENPEAFLYDVVMDLRANDIEMTGMSHDIDDMDELAESSESDYLKRMNDPLSMKWRTKSISKVTPSVRASNPNSEKEKGLSLKDKQLIAQLKRQRERVMSDMEQEAEPTGGPISDKYGDILHKIDTAIEKIAAKGVRPKSTHYDDRNVQEYMGEGQKEALYGDPKMDKAWADKIKELSKDELKTLKSKLHKAGYGAGNQWSGSKESMVKFQYVDALLSEDISDEEADKI
jgi:hypothetical protein